MQIRADVENPPLSLCGIAKLVWCAALTTRRLLWCRNVDTVVRQKCWLWYLTGRNRHVSTVLDFTCSQVASGSCLTEGESYQLNHTPSTSNQDNEPLLTGLGVDACSRGHHKDMPRRMYGSVPCGPGRPLTRQGKSAHQGAYRPAKAPHQQVGSPRRPMPACAAATLCTEF